MQLFNFSVHFLAYVIILFEVCCMSNTGAKIKEIRLEKGMSVNALSKKVGMSHTAINRIENDDTKSITIETGLKIANALNIGFNELFGIDSPKKDEKLTILTDEILEYRQLLTRLTGLIHILDDEFDKLTKSLMEMQSEILEKEKSFDNPILDMIIQATSNINVIQPHLKNSAEMAQKLLNQNIVPPGRIR